MSKQLPGCARLIEAQIEMLRMRTESVLIKKVLWSLRGHSGHIFIVHETQIYWNCLLCLVDIRSKREYYGWMM